MNSKTTKRFRKSFQNLPKHIQEKARNSYRLWKTNPHHPGLQFKQIHPSLLIYAVRIGLGYRAIGILENQTMIWFWIGSHSDYNSMITKL